jgi:hypothetical protein
MLLHKDGTIPRNSIFVFGSNLAGKHGLGAAKIARVQFKAKPGVGFGRTGQAYAIATKDANLVVLPIKEIRNNVEQFLDYAEANPEIKFFVTRVGCGLAGYRDSTIAALFAPALSNCSYSEEWEQFL